MRERIKQTIVVPGRGHANGYGEVAEAIEQRMAGMPKAVWDGNEGRMVPVAYDVQIVQLVDSEQYRSREGRARYALQLAEARNPSPATARMQQEANACMARYTHAQQSDDGIGISFMTRSERALAATEWGKRLRELIEAGKRRDREREPSVVVDLDYDD